MRGNSFGKMFSITSFGESHGPAIGVVIDGMPANITISETELHKQLLRRAPGQHAATTSRKEDDIPEILSGIFEGKTLGTPITVIVRNTNQQSSDYDALRTVHRAGHADKTTMQKYGIRDYRGGGRASGRETIARVIGGYFAGLIISEISVYAYVEQIGKFKLTNKPKHGADRGPLNVPDEKLEQQISDWLQQLKGQGESASGILGLSIEGCPTGLGEPAFDKLKADLTKALMSIGGCMGVEVGSGFATVDMSGSELSQNSSYFGGMEGGISNGETITMRAIFKAPSTVGEKAKAGRHDPCLLPRVVPVAEAMAKIVLADHWLRQQAYLVEK